MNRFMPVLAFAFYIFVLCCIAAVAQKAQTPMPAPAATQKPAEPAPKLTDAQRIDILTLQNQKHAVKEQMDQLTIEYLQRQLQATNNFNQAQGTLTQIDSQLSTKLKETGVDLTKYEIDPETATTREKKTAANTPPPAAPAK